jgi:hypothetical protein
VAKRASKSTDARPPESVKESLLLVENGKQGAQLSKRADPAFIKFTTYIRKTTHLAVKTRLVSKEKELSDLVEELLSNWLKKNESFEA